MIKSSQVNFCCHKEIFVVPTKSLLRTISRFLDVISILLITRKHCQGNNFLAIMMSIFLRAHNNSTLLSQSHKSSSAELECLQYEKILTTQMVFRTSWEKSIQNSRLWVFLMWHIIFNEITLHFLRLFQEVLAEK